MKKIFLTIAVFITVNNLAFSHEEKQDTVKAKDNMKTVIHIHPVTLIPSLFSSSTNSESFYYLTIEIPLSLSNSLIIKPSVWINISEKKFLMFRKRDEFSRLGGDIGLLHYPSEKGEGFYLQGQCGAFFVENINTGETHIVGDIMGYLGVSAKRKRVGFFFDVGVGLGNSNVMFKERNFESKGVFDINIGLGLKF